MDRARFIALFPVFGNDALFPVETVDLWLTLSADQCPAKQWKSKREMGVFLLTAHNLTLMQAASLSTTGTGGFDAAQGGVTSESKAVGSMSLSRTKAGAASTGHALAGHYNSTSYGQQYWNLVQMVGMGAFVV